MLQLFSLIFFYITITAQSSEADDFSYSLKLYNEKYYDLALKEFNKFSQRYPNSNLKPDAFFYIAKSYLNLTDTLNTINYYRRISLDYPNFSKADEAWFNIGTLYQSQNKWLDAANAFESIKLLYPKSNLVIEALYLSALAHDKNKNLIQSEKVLRIIINDFKESTYINKARLQLVTILKKLNKLSEANTLLNKISETSENKLILNFLKGELAIENMDDDLALTYFLKTDFNNSDLQEKVNFHIANIYFKRSDYLKAENYFLMLLRSNDVSIKLGDIYYLKNEFSKSVNYYPKNLNLETDLKISLCYLHLKDFKNESKTYDFILKNYSSIDQNLYEEIIIRNVIALKSFASSNDQINFIQSYYTQLKQISSQRELSKELASTYLKRQEFELALNVYNRFISNDISQENSDEIIFLKASLLEQIGKITEAKEFYTLVVNKYPLSKFNILAEQVLKKFTSIKTNVESLSLLSDVISKMIFNSNKTDLTYLLADLNFNHLGRPFAALSIIENGLKLTDDKKKLSTLFLLKAEILIYLASQQSNDSTAYKINATLINVLENDSSKLEDILIKKTEAKKILYKATISDSMAIVNFEKLLTLTNLKNPDKIKFQLASFYNLINNYTKALSTVQKINKLNLFDEVYFLKGELLTKLDSLDQAIDSFKELCLLFPLSKLKFESYQKIISLHIKKGSIKESIAFKQLLYSEYPAIFPSAYKDDLISYYIENKQFKQAESLINFNQVEVSNDIILIQEFNLLSISNYIHLAKYYDYKDNNEKAIHYYKQYLRFVNSSNMNDEIFQSLAEIYLEDNNTDKAIKYYEKIKLNYKTYDKVRYALAILYLKTKQFGLANVVLIDILKTLNKDDINYIEFNRSLILSKIKLNQIKNIESELKSYQKQFQKDLEGQALLIFELALQKRQNKNFTESNNTLEIILEDYQSTSYLDDANYFKALNFVAVNNFEQANLIFNTFPKQFTNSPIMGEFYNTIGSIYSQYSKLDEAVQAFRQAIDLANNPNSKKLAYKNLINTYPKLSMWEALLGTASTFIQLFPDDTANISIKILIGQSYANLNRGSEGINYFKQLKLEVDSENEPEIQYYIADTYFKIQDYESAISEYIKIPLLSKQTKLQWVPSALYYAGQCYERLNKNTEAIKMYEEIINRSGIDAVFKNEAKKRINQLKQSN